MAKRKLVPKAAKSSAKGMAKGRSKKSLKSAMENVDWKNVKNVKIKYKSAAKSTSGPKCPKCSAESPQELAPIHDKDVVRQPYRCRVCGKRWEHTFD